MQIKIEHLCHHFNEQEYVLDDINFEASFSSLALIGPSGGGKSTLLRILGGLIKPSKGSFYYNNKPIHYDKLSQQEWYQKVSFVFQSNGLFPHLTSIENITLPLIHVFSIEEKQAKQIAFNLLERFNLMKQAYKYPKELSGGQQQRIAIARAISSKPSLLLLDEPTSALDPEYTSEVLNMINELYQDGLEIIVVTHEMGFAKHACEKALFLHDGKIKEYNDSSLFFNNPKTKELQLFLNKILEWNN